jgi:Pyruvate/2-oxoacid:ferredoxin oxidoreductase gamma subunit
MNRVNDFAFKIATANGTGSASANGLIMQAIFRMGVPVTGKNVFPSNIQGLPTWYEIRVNKNGYSARTPDFDLMVALNAATYKKDVEEVRAGGWLLYDSTWPLDASLKRPDITYLGVPLAQMCNNAFKGVRERILMKNIAYAGALANRHCLGRLRTRRVDESHEANERLVLLYVLEHRRKLRQGAIRHGENAEAGHRRDRRQIGRDLDPVEIARVRRARELLDLPRAEDIERRENGQHGRDAEHRRDALREQSAEQAPECAGTLNLTEALLRRSRIEALARDQPEPGAEHRTQPRHVQVDEHDGDPGQRLGERPFGQQQDGTRSEHRRDELCGPELRDEARSRGNQKDRRR